MDIPTLVRVVIVAIPAPYETLISLQAHQLWLLVTQLSWDDFGTGTCNSQLLEPLFKT